MNIPIIYEDEDLLAINKPAGLVVHYDGKTDEPSVVTWLLSKYPDMKNVGEPVTLSTGEVIDRPGIVHRIDRETSGVLLIAKNARSFLFFKQQFQDRNVRKTYLAFVYGEMKESEAIITKPIGRSKKDFRQFAVGREARGVLREAVTHYTVLDRGQVEGEGYSFVEVAPRTGRTHQIRVHFKSIHYPVVADKLYAPNRLRPALGFDRLALHASRIEVTSLTGQTLIIEAPLPADFKKAKKLLKG